MTGFAERLVDTGRSRSHGAFVGCVVALASASLGAVTAQRPLLGVAVATVATLGAVMVLWPQLATLTAVVLVYSNAVAIAVTVHDAPPVVSAVVPLLLAVPLTHHLVIGRRPVVFPPATPWIVAYLLVQVVATTLAADRALAIENLLVFLTEGLVLYLLLVNAIRTTATLRRAVWSIVVLAAVFGLLSLHQASTGNYDADYLGFAQNSEVKLEQYSLDAFGEHPPPRVGGPIGKKNRYAQILVIVMPIGIALGRHERSARVRTAAWAAVAAMAVGVALTSSRGAAVALVLTLLAMLMMRQFKAHHVALVVIGVLMLLSAFPRYAERFATATPVVTEGASLEEADGSVRGRLTANLGALQVYADHPVVGVGPGNYPLYHEDEAVDIGIRVAESRQPHNLYPQVAAETGTLGLVAFLGLIVTTLLDLLRVRARVGGRGTDIEMLATGLLFAMVTYLATAVFLHMAYARYFWLLLALCGAAGRIGATEAEALDGVESASWRARRTGSAAIGPAHA